MTAKGIFKVIEDDSMYPDEASHPARVWRGTEAECEAWIEGVGHRHPFQVALGYITVGPFEPVALPYAVIDRSAPMGEGRILERHANEAEAREYVDVMGRFGMLDAHRPHYGVVHESDLASALAAPSTRLLPGDAVLVGRSAKGAPPWYPELSNFESSTEVRTVETGFGTVDVRMCPTGQLRVSAGMKVGRSTAQGPLVLPGVGGPGGSVAFDMILDLRGNEATLAGMRRTVHDASDAPSGDAALIARADRQAFAAARAAVQVMASEHPNARLEALHRYHGNQERAAEARLHDLRCKLRDAESKLKLHRDGKEAAARALEAAAVLDEAPAPAMR